MDTVSWPQPKPWQSEFQQGNGRDDCTPRSHLARWCKRTLGPPHCAVCGGIHPPYILHIALRVTKNQSKSILWKILLEEKEFSKSDEFLFSASFIGALLEIKQRRQFSGDVCSVLESWMSVKWIGFGIHEVKHSRSPLKSLATEGR